jgi:sec-independent protein translocase protein TatA
LRQASFPHVVVRPATAISKDGRTHSLQLARGGFYSRFRKKTWGFSPPPRVIVQKKSAPREYNCRIRVQLSEEQSAVYIKFMIPTLASLLNLAGPDMMVILLIVLLLFGAKKLPELAKGMGRAVKEFNSARDEIEKGMAQTTPSAVAPRIQDSENARSESAV